MSALVGQTFIWSIKDGAEPGRIMDVLLDSDDEAISSIERLVPQIEILKAFTFEAGADYKTEVERAEHAEEAEAREKARADRLMKFVEHVAGQIVIDIANPYGSLARETLREAAALAENTR